MSKEQDAMQILKAMIRPLIPVIVDLIEEYKAEQEVEREADRQAAIKEAVKVEAKQLPVSVTAALSEPPPVKLKKTQPPKPELSEEEKAYQVYLALPERLRESMRGFVDGESLSTFQDSSFPIERFWEFCKTELQRNDGLNNRDQIALLFEFFFVRHVTQSGEQLFLYEPSQGERFASARMTASNAGSKVGSVESTVLKGYYSSQEVGNGEVETIKHKAVVLLR